MNRTADIPNAKLFWQSLLEESEVLRRQITGGAIRAAYDRVQELLQFSNVDFVHELTYDDDGDAVLVFSPESNPDVAKRIDAFVDAAPLLPKWKVFTRRQRKPANDAFVMLRHVYSLNASDATFLIQRLPNGFSVTMYSAVASELGAAEATGFVHFFLEHALGEALAMAYVSDASVQVPQAEQKGITPQQLVDFFVQIAST
jgi:hypothetical protein